MKASTIAAVAVTALLVGIAALGISIGAIVVAAVDEPMNTLLQSGTMAWDMYYNSVLTSLPSTYRLYQAGSHYTLQIDYPASELEVPNGDASASSFVQVRMHTFAPVVTPLSTPGYLGTLFPLSQSNLALLVSDGACYDPPSPTCNIAGKQGLGNITQNSIAAALESTSHGYLTFYMQTIANSTQNWGNYTLGVAGTLSIFLPSA